MNHSRWVWMGGLVGGLMLTGQSTCQTDDADGDDWTIEQGDCNDMDANTYPGAVELCDGTDNNCDKLVDNGANPPEDATFCATDPLANGTFESGLLEPWVSVGVNGGMASVVTEGTQFSSNGTAGVAFVGPIHAANVRSSGPAPVDSVGVMQSQAFFATFPAVRFMAVSETSAGRPDPSEFGYRITDVNGVVLADSGDIETGIVDLIGGSDNVYGPELWSSHCIDLTSFVGGNIRLEFYQHTNYNGSGYFTLLDQIQASTDVCQ